MAESEPARRLAIAGATGLVGSRLATLARQAGHQVVGLSRSTGVDLTVSGSIGDRLEGVDTLVDVTRSPSMSRGEAVEFFTTVAANLARAARAANVRRVLVLSIVGIEKCQDYDWYVATLAHERTIRDLGPGARVLRATQFHEFPAQVLDRAPGGDTAQIMDIPIQPVPSGEVARVLLDMATEDASGDVELAGPRQERLVDLVGRVAVLRADPVTVEPVPAPTSMASGSLLPGPDALIRGLEWEAWARATYT